MAGSLSWNEICPSRRGGPCLCPAGTREYEWHHLVPEWGAQLVPDDTPILLLGEDGTALLSKRTED